MGFWVCEQASPWFLCLISGSFPSVLLVGLAQLWCDRFFFYFIMLYFVTFYYYHLLEVCSLILKDRKAVDMGGKQDGGGTGRGTGRRNHNQDIWSEKTLLFSITEEKNGKSGGGGSWDFFSWDKEAGRHPWNPKRASSPSVSEFNNLRLTSFHILCLGIDPLTQRHQGIGTGFAHWQETKAGTQLWHKSQSLLSVVFSYIANQEVPNHWGLRGWHFLFRVSLELLAFLPSFR